MRPGNFIKRQAARVLFRALWLFKLDWLVAELLVVFLLLYNRETLRSAKKGSRFILILERVIFNDDVKALKEYSEENNLPYQFILYPSSFRKFLSETFWPQEILGQVSFYPHRYRHQKFLERVSGIYGGMLRALERRTGIKPAVVLSCLIDYAQDYPWMGALRRSGGKFLVLNKESIIYSSFFAKELSDIYRKYDFYFEGDAVLFYNEFGKEAYVAPGSVARERAYVTGCPRVDGLVNLVLDKAEEEPFILLASFQDPAYHVPKLWRAVLQAVYKDPSLRSRIVVKCRSPREVTEIAAEFPGIESVSGSLGHYLQKSPSVFVGFNSTACLDAMIVGIPLVVPWWGEAEQMGNDVLLGPHTREFHEMADSPVELIRILKEHLRRGRADASTRSGWRKNPRQKKFLEYRYSPLDGKNCERFFQFLDSLP